MNYRVKYIVLAVAAVVFAAAAMAESLASIAEKEKQRQKESVELHGPSLKADNKTLENLDKNKIILNEMSKPDFVDRFEKMVIEEAKKEADKEKIFTERIINARRMIRDSEASLKALEDITPLINNKLKNASEFYKDMTRAEALTEHQKRIDSVLKKVEDAKESLDKLLKEAKEEDIAPGIIRDAMSASLDSK